MGHCNLSPEDTALNSLIGPQSAPLSQCSQRPPLAQPKWVRSIGTPPAVLGFSPRQIEADHSSWRLLSPFRRIKRWRKALGEVLLRAWLWAYHRLTHLRKTRHQHVQHRTHEPSFGVLSSTVTKWSRTCQVDHPHANFSQYIAKAPADCLLSIGQGLGACIPFDQPDRPGFNSRPNTNQMAVSV